MRVKCHCIAGKWWWNIALYVLIPVMVSWGNELKIATASISEPASVVVLVSMKIRPYLDAVDGITDFFDSEKQTAKLHLIYVEDYPGGGGMPLIERIEEISPRLIISIGPDAAQFSWAAFHMPEVRKVYAMVLGPDKILPAAGISCGVSLNIPPDIQMSRYRAALPELKRIGLIYDPALNSTYAKEMADKAAFIGLHVTHIEVSSKKDLPELLTRHWEGIDSLWFIPDRTVISEGLVQYIIKEAITRKIAVIGYNRFFYENGAALSFVFDYRKIGFQSARLGARVISGGECEMPCPVFDTWLNFRVTRKIGVKALPDSSLGIVEGP
ncbi:MAG: ABC transporter substrate binding protein [Pseudomonadota bacterium]